MFKFSERFLKNVCPVKKVNIVSMTARTGQAQDLNPDHNTENSKKIFLEKKMRGHSRNSYIHGSLRDLLAYSAAGNRWTDHGNI
jgi:hypothetical protein